MGIRTVGHKVKANSKDCGTLQSLGEISQKRAVKEYDPINAEDILQALGKIKTDPIAMSVIYDPDDALGVGELEAAFKAATPIPFAIELSDKLITTGTTFTWALALINEFKLTQDADGFVIANFTANLNGAPTVTAAA
ncbi:MAG: hypothetical protein COA44_06190 [Arcobacter sp.]|nr:MAG: hypothetical protein COA44_06190 [Arcobacter sp.]